MDARKGYLAVFDELNNIVTDIARVVASANKSPSAEEEALELLEVAMLDAYTRGHSDTNKMLGATKGIKPEEARAALEKRIENKTASDRLKTIISSLNDKNMNRLDDDRPTPDTEDGPSEGGSDALSAKEESLDLLDMVALDADYEDAVASSEDVGTASIERLLETEMHRMYCTGQADCAESVAEDGTDVYKTWVTEGDNRVRDTHLFVEGVTKALREPFYTYDGDSAMYPGDFTQASNNINCRCWLTYSLGEQA